LVVITTVLFGLPHGALDLVVAEWYAKTHKAGFDLGSFLVKYIGGMVGTLAVWYVSPGLWLLLFMIASIAHFGEVLERCYTHVPLF
jgi:hypothetical protein